MKGKKEKKSGRLIFLLVVTMPILILLLSLGTAQLILSGMIPEAATEAAVLVIGGVSAFTISLICGLRVPQKKFLWSVVTAAGGGCAMLLGNLLFFGDGFGKVWPMLLTVMASGLLAGILAAGKRRKYA